uniref:Ubiquitinyl hydrolase 1 n=1 Tax=Clytia hemisphaerica TaxID=252671 RepID=A0A7M5WIL6_9CNID
MRRLLKHYMLSVFIKLLNWMFKLQIDCDIEIVKARRKVAYNLLETVKILIDDYFTYNDDLIVDLKKDLGIDSTVFHLNQLCAKISVEMSYFLYEHVVLSDDQLLVDIFLDVVTGDTKNLKFRYVKKSKLENDKDFGNNDERFLAHGNFVPPRIRIFFPMIEACLDEVNTCFPNDITRSDIEIGRDLINGKGNIVAKSELGKSPFKLTIVSPKPEPNEIANHPGLMREFLDIGFTKLSYPFLDVGSLYVDDLKSWICHIFGIRCHEQVVLRVYEKDIATVDELLITSWGPIPCLYWFAVFINTTNHKAFKPFNYPDKNHIKMQKVQSIPIIIKSENKNMNFHFESWIKKNERIEEVIEQKLDIPKNRLCINHNYQHEDFVAEQTKRVWQENLHALKTEWRKINLYNKSINSEYFYDTPPSSHSPLKYNIGVFVKDTESELLENLQKNGVRAKPIMQSVLIKHGGKTFCEFSFSVLNMFACPGDQQYQTICQFIRRQFSDITPEVISLKPEGDIANDQSKDSVFNLFLNPLRFQGDVDTFCQKYGLAKKLKINFLTGQFSVDLFSEEGRKLEDIHDLKTYVYEKKGIPPHLQSYFHNRIELSYGARLFEFLSLGTKCTLNLVVLPAKDIDIKCTLGKEEFSLQIKETCTMLDLKKKVGEQCGLSMELFRIQLNCSRDYDDLIPIWELGVYNMIIRRAVYFTIHQTDGKVLVEKDRHFFFDEGKDTIESLQKEIQEQYFRNESKGGILLKNREFDSDTKLIDIWEIIITFVVYSEPVNVCNIC